MHKWLPEIGFAVLLCVAFTACAKIKVDAIRLTTESFPPKNSANEVEPVGHKPARPYKELADLHAMGDSASFEELQNSMLKKAGQLGADAIVFADGDSHLKQGVSYQPIYSPWGYDDPSYGPDPGGYGGYGDLGYGTGTYMAVPYEIQVKALKGTAIRYID